MVVRKTPPSLYPEMWALGATAAACVIFKSLREGSRPESLIIFKTVRVRWRPEIPRWTLGFACITCSQLDIRLRCVTSKEVDILRGKKLGEDKEVDLLRGKKIGCGPSIPGRGDDCATELCVTVSFKTYTW